MAFLSRWYAKFLRRSHAGLRRLDRLDLPLFARLDPKLKSRLVRKVRRLLSARLQETQEIDGLQITIPREMHYTYIVLEFEPRTRRFLRQVLEPGMRVLDVGANIGLLTALMAREVGPRGRVWAIEPEPKNVKLLRRNLARNGLEDRVEVITKAAGARSHSSTLHLTEDGTGHSLYSATGQQKSGVEVEVRPLEEMIDGRIDLVKIDVEGGELDVLSGMSSILQSNPRLNLVIEWNPSAQVRAGHSADDLPKYLTEQGFVLELLPECDGPEDLELAMERLKRGELPDRWYANLHGVRPTSPRGFPAPHGTL